MGKIFTPGLSIITDKNELSDFLYILENIDDKHIYHNSHFTDLIMIYASKYKYVYIIRLTSGLLTFGYCNDIKQIEKAFKRD